MEQKTRISHDDYFAVVKELEPKWRVIQVGDLYSLQYKNREPNGWGREPRGNESASLDKIIEVYNTRVKLRSGSEKIKIRKEMETLHAEDYYKDQALRHKRKPQKRKTFEEYTKLI